MAIGTGVNPFLLIPGRLEEMESIRRLREAEQGQSLPNTPSTAREPIPQSRPQLLAQPQGIQGESLQRIDRLVDQPLPGTGALPSGGVSDESFQRIDRLVDQPLPGAQQPPETNVVPPIQPTTDTEASSPGISGALTGAGQNAGSFGGNIPVQSTLTGAGTGAAIGSVGGPVGTGIGAAVGAAGGLIAGLFSQSAQNEERQKQAKLAAAQAIFQGESQDSDEEQLALRNLLTGVQGPILR